MSPRFQASCHTASRACSLWGYCRGVYVWGLRCSQNPRSNRAQLPSLGSFLQAPSVTPCLSRHFSPCLLLLNRASLPQTRYYN